MSATIAFGALYFLVVGLLLAKDMVDAFGNPGLPWWALAVASGTCFLNAHVLIKELAR